ncbi:MAG: hypothetical protein R2708_28045 [Vicinamibacterales bacterium]
MFAIAARRMGYRIHRSPPGLDTPTGQVADGDRRRLRRPRRHPDVRPRHVDVITFEFENVSTAAADAADEIVPVRPGGRAASRSSGPAKAFLALKGFPVTRSNRSSRSRGWR